jgi:molybdenum cofactor guanylyltransferase
MIRREHITAAILAGGRGRRMGGADKGLVRFQGRPLIRYVVDTIQPQVATIIVSANRHLNRYAELGFPVVPDRATDFGGPLAGIARVLEHADTPYLLVVPCDMPSLPEQLVERLAKGLAANDTQATVAYGAGRLQPLCVLLQRDVVQDLHSFRASGGTSVEKWLRSLRHTVVDFSGQPAAFRNINTPADLVTALDYEAEAATI